MFRMDILQHQNGGILVSEMPVNLSIKNAPDDVVELVKERAQKNHRSLRGELLAIIESVVRPSRLHRMSPHEVLEQAKELGLQSPSESAAIVRAMRDERYGR
jgi:plasmid stability protein